MKYTIITHFISFFLLFKTWPLENLKYTREPLPVRSCGWRLPGGVDTWAGYEDLWESAGDGGRDEDGG